LILKDWPQLLKEIDAFVLIGLLILKVKELKLILLSEYGELPLLNNPIHSQPKFRAKKAG